MKPTRIVLEPTRSRPVNIFLGLLLLLVSALLFLSLATWHATDPSLNTSTDPVATHAARNWIGIFGALISDLMLQVLGLTSFLIPIWIGGLGWTWMRSRSGGSPILRWIGTLFALTFIPTVFALLPWRWNWMHLIPVEGVVGKLMAGMLVGYLNIQGAWVVAGVLAAMGLYFASAISFWALKESFEERWIHVVSWYERWRNWREQRAEARAEREIEESDSEPEPEPAVQTESHKAGFFASLFRRRREAEADPIDEIPAFKRTGMLRDEEEPVAIEPRRPSIWERSDDRLDERETAAPVCENWNDISDPRDAVPQPPKVAPIRPPVTPQPAHFTPAARSSDQPPAAFRSPSLGFETAAAAPSRSSRRPPARSPSTDAPMPKSAPRPLRPRT